MTSLRQAIASAVDIPSPDPDAPGPFRYADAGKLLALLAQTGFRELAAHPWRGALPIGGGLTAAKAAQFALTSFSIGELLADAREDVVTGVYESLAARFADHERGGEVWMEAFVHVVTGSKTAQTSAQL